MTTLHEWQTAGTQAKRSLRRKLQRRLGKRFRESGRCGSFDLPVFVDTLLDLEFVLTPGGSFHFGISAAERRAARALAPHMPLATPYWRPARLCEVGPMLVARRPMSFAAASRVTELGTHRHRPIFDIHSTGPCPIWLGWDEVAGICSRTGYAVATEIECEHYLRAGTATLFVTGSRLPDTDTLQHVLSARLDGPDVFENAFGLRGLYFGEWCSNWFQHGSIYREATDLAYAGWRSVRGGAAALWPWQDADEWIHMASGVRMHSGELLDGTFGFRPVIGLGDER